MKNGLLVFVASLVASFAFGNDYRALPWPVGPAGDQHLTRTIHNAFGNWHLSWDLIGNPAYPINFHNGIDILPYAGNREVRAVKAGCVSHIYVSTAGEYVVVLVDELNTTTGSSHGWSYGHLEDPFDYGWELNDSIPQYALIFGDEYCTYLQPYAFLLESLHIRLISRFRS